MTMPKRKPWSTEITEYGITVRVYEREPGGVLYRSIVTADGRKDRKSLGHRDRDRAEKDVRTLIGELAEAKLTGVKPDTLTLGQLFGAYRRERMPSLKPDRQAYSRACMAMFTECWGADQVVADIGQQHVDRFVGLRRSAELVPPALKPRAEGERRGRGHRRAVPVRDGTLHANLIGWLSPVFNWAVRYKVNGSRLLASNPLHDCEVPREKTPRRPIASHARYTATQEHADAVDSTGRLRCILALARYTGRRESAICQLRASDVLLSTERVRDALAAEGMDERVADHMPHGAIRWGEQTDKEGLLFVTAMSAAARAEVDRYLTLNPRLGDVPLFPAPPRKRKKEAEPPPERPITRHRASELLLAAEVAARQPKLMRGAWHAYRRLWASERKHLPDADVAAAGGWSDPETMKKSYQQPDAATMLRVINT
jgi:hypothetical protein